MKKKSNLLVSAVLLMASSCLLAEDAYEIIEIKNTNILEGNLEPEDNLTFAYGINNNDTVVGNFTVLPLYDDVNGNGIDEDSELVAPSYSHSYIFNSTVIDLGAIDNSELLVEITNVVNGEDITSIEDIGIDNTPSFGFSINDNELTAGFSYKLIGSVDSSEETDEDGNIITVQTAVSSTLERAVYSSLGDDALTVIPDFKDDDEQNMRSLALNKNNIIVGFGRYNPDDDVNSEGDEVDFYYDKGFVYKADTQELIMANPLGGISSYRSSVKDININNIAVGKAQRLVNDRVTQGVFYLDVDN